MGRSRTGTAILGLRVDLQRVSDDLNHVTLDAFAALEMHRDEGVRRSVPLTRATRTRVRLAVIVPSTGDTASAHRQHVDQWRIAGTCVGPPVLRSRRRPARAPSC